MIFGVIAYFGLNFALSAYLQKPQTGTTVTDPATGKTITVPANTEEIPPYLLRPTELDEGAVRLSIPRKVAPIWPQDSPIDIIVTLSPSFSPIPISQTPSEYIVLDEKNYLMDNSLDIRQIETSFKVPKAVQNNGTLWGHFYIGLAGSKLDPRQPGFDPGSAYHFTWPMTQYLVKKKVKKTRNLLSDVPESEQEIEEVDTTGPLVTNHYHPNASFAFVPAMGVKDFASIHPAAKQFVYLESTGARDGSGKNSWYCKYYSLVGLMSNISVADDAPS